MDRRRAGPVARRCQAVHTGSVAAALSPGADALLDLWRRLRDGGRTLLSYDPNIRPALVGSRAGAVARAEALRCGLARGQGK